MSRWLKRWLAYLLLPACVVLLFVPLNTHRTGDVERDFLFLEISETLTAVASPGETNAPPSKPDSMESAWRQLEERRKQKALEEARAAAVVNAYGYPRIQSEDLAPYPALSKEVETMRRVIGLGGRDRTGLTRLDDVPLAEWASFRDAVAASGKGDAFQYGKYIFRGHVESARVSVPIEVKNLKTGCKVAGGVFLIVGLFMLGGSYAPPSGGIRVGKRSAIVTWDVVIIAVGIPFTWWFLDMLLTQVFRTVPDCRDDIAWGMGVFWVVCAYPVLALITTATSIQTLSITPDAIVLQGLLGSTSMAWSEVESLRVSQVCSPRKARGMWAPHRVMKVLEISGGASTLRVLEPPCASTKREILAALMEHAPEECKANIQIMSKEWLSSW